MFAELTVRDNLLMGAFRGGARSPSDLADDLDRVLAEFPWLTARLSQLAGTLSGGEQQMVAMARAWLRRPKVLCIDEPSMGLLADNGRPHLRDPDALESAGLTILMVEQSANRALELVDRAYVLRNGAITLEGEAAELIADPAIREAYLGIGREGGAVIPARAKPEAEMASPAA